MTLSRMLHRHAPGLTARSALEKFSAMQRVDVHLPTRDGREHGVAENSEAKIPSAGDTSKRSKPRTTTTTVRFLRSP
ncbi:MAG: hypothetical protein IT481_04585 [Gammaproteobacteria bacterium]|nr:hypothetical protein [Gammaproteobacteria bacterium]